MQIGILAAHKPVRILYAPTVLLCALFSDTEARAFCIPPFVKNERNAKQ